MATIAPGGTKNAVGRSKKSVVFFGIIPSAPLCTFRDFLSLFDEKVLKKNIFVTPSLTASIG